MSNGAEQVYGNGNNSRSSVYIYLRYEGRENPASPEDASLKLGDV